MTKFCLYFSFTVHYFFSKISSFTLILSRRTDLDSFYLLIFCFEKFSTTLAVNLTLNLSSDYSQSVIYSAHTFDSSLKPLERVGAGERRASKARKLCFQYFILIYSTIGYIWLFTSTLAKHGKRLKTLLHRTFWHFWKSAGSGRTEVFKNMPTSSLFLLSRRLSLALFSLLFCLFCSSALTGRTPCTFKVIKHIASVIDDGLTVNLSNLTTDVKFIKPRNRLLRENISL